MNMADHAPGQQALTIEQALDLAMQHHAAGRLPEAEKIYQQILQIGPNQPVALHLLGVIAHQVGKNDIAVGLITKALAIKPDYAEAHNNLGLAFQGMGKLDDAVASYGQALAIQPDFASVHCNLGVALHDLRKIDEAFDSYHKALAIKHDYAEAHSNLVSTLLALGRLDEAVEHGQKAICINPQSSEAHLNLGNALQSLREFNQAVACYNHALAIAPDYAEAHNNLGKVLQELGNSKEAEASCRKALALKPEYAEAHNNLGIVLKDMGKLDDAIASHQKALAIMPDFAGAHNNLGAALLELGKLDEAVASFRKALAVMPNFAGAHQNLGLALRTLGRFSDAKAAFDQVLRINHGGRLFNAARFTDDHSAAASAPAAALETSAFKLQDRIDQIDYLIAMGRIDSSFGLMANHYRGVLAEIQSTEAPEAVTRFSADQWERIGSFYNRVIHFSEAPRIAAGTLSDSLNFKQIEDKYLSSPLSVTSMDEFLTPDALLNLRDFLLESTIYFFHSSNRFVAGQTETGFNCHLIYQLATEVKAKFPRVLGDHDLNRWWVYRYNNQSEGVAAHTDEGAVTFNFWITPDKANLLPDSGGLMVYTKDQPYDWDWKRHNFQKNTEAVRQDIATFLADADSVTIPHRENRAVLFHSNLFHKSDNIHFRDGFENRRMNVTLLFGKRATR
jgi:tetratricopeptide (TPR) repeat protein